MKLKKITLILIVILAVLTLIAGAVTFTSNNSIIETPKGNASVVVTGDVMFARNMAGVLSLDESPFRHVENVTGSADLLLINFESTDVMPQANGSNPGYSAYDSDVAKCQIQDAKANGSDVVIVYFHFGNEYSRSPNPDQEKMAHEVIDYGADAVLGSHPHVTQGIEMYKGKPIFYSLGNFIFDMSNSATHIAYIVKMDFVNDTGECTVYPVIISGYLPYFMGPDEGTSLLNSLSPQCDDLEITPEGTGKLYFNLTGDTNES